MQIRTRNGNMEFLRATYDPQKKRSVQKLIKREDFTPEEQAQFDAQQAEKKAKSDAATFRLAAEEPSYWLSKITAGLLAGHRPIDEKEFWADYTNLQKAIRKSGLKRPENTLKAPKKPTKKAVKRKPKQQNLTL